MIVYGIATCYRKGWQESYESWCAHALQHFPAYIVGNQIIEDAYDLIYRHTTAPIIAFIHDDTIIHEDNWDRRVLKAFCDPTVGVVGFGGAPRFGHPQLYKIPYELPQLARYGFQSNMRNAEAHGTRFTGERDVAVLDGFAIFVRRELLDEAGGWPVGTPIGYFGYDMWICATAKRYGYKCRLVGVDCDHLSGKSTGLNPNLKLNHAEMHEWFYNEFRDVMPIEVAE